MITDERSTPDIVGSLISFSLLLAIIVTYGREALEWLLMRLYELFI